jgi:TolB-like protein
MDTLWPGVTVEEANLTVAVSQLRKVINQNGDKGEFIQTIPRVGYRFVADVREVTEERPPGTIHSSAVTHTVNPEESTGQLIASSDPGVGLREREFKTVTSLRRWNRILLAVGVVLVFAVGAFLVSYLRIRNLDSHLPSLKSTTLAVLPFRVLGSKMAEDDYIGPGIADSINMRLSRIKQFAVRPNTSVLKFNGASQNALEAGRKLEVEKIIEGQIEYLGDRVRATSRLLRVRDGALLWHDSFDAQLDSLFTVEESISRQVAQALQLKLTPEEEQQLASRTTNNPEAFHAYLRGRHAWNKRTPDEFRKAIKFFQQAIDLDPVYAAAHAGLADCYLLLGDYGGEAPNDTFPLARGAALRALEIDEGLAEAHATIAHTKFLFYWDFAGAEQEYLRAIELKPNYATAHHWHGLFLAAMGKNEEAMREIRLAQELDPLSFIIRANVGLVDYFARRYDEAIGQERKLLDSDTGFVPARQKLAFALEAKGEENEAIVEWLKVEREMGANEETLAAYKQACASSGIKGYWSLALENDRKEVGREAASLSSYYARLGDREQAFTWLDRAYTQRDPWLVYAKVTPVYDNLRSDPRFDAFLQRLGLVTVPGP